MKAKRRYDVDSVIISPGRTDADAFWEFSSTVSRGVIFHYLAYDANLPSRVPWSFTLHVPHEFRKGEYTLLGAVDFPRIQAWTPIARTVINFAKATISPYRGHLYAKIRLMDPHGVQKYESVTWQQRASLPPYLEGFLLLPKRKVATTRGTDAESLVAVIPSEDHCRMIRLFFATKVWPLYSGLPATTRRALDRHDSR